MNDIFVFSVASNTLGFYLCKKVDLLMGSLQRNLNTSTNSTSLVLMFAPIIPNAKYSKIYTYWPQESKNELFLNIPIPILLKPENMEEGE